MCAAAQFGVLIVNCDRDVERSCCVDVCKYIEVIGDIDVGTAIDEGVMCGNGAVVIYHATYSGLAYNM